MDQVEPALRILVTKYLTNRISDGEQDVLRGMLRQPENRERFKALVRANQKLDSAYREIDAEKAYRQIMVRTSRRPSKKVRLALRYAATGLLLLGMGYGLYRVAIPFWEVPAGKGQDNAQAITLELEDGSVRVLDLNASGAVQNKEGSSMAFQKRDKLTYEDAANATSTDLAYNRLKIPNGKRFQLELSDGTRVHLNAGTELKYPSAFTDPVAREVFLRGEAFFEVKEKKDHPFIVRTDKMNLRVLGTTFNVSSYGNQAPSAVLVSGSVGVYRPLEEYPGEGALVLSPSQQVHPGPEGFKVSRVDPAKYIAWTKGRLFFMDDRFGDIVKELERHYNVKILSRSSTLNDQRYTGSFGPDETLSDVLGTFRRNTRFDYRIQGDQVTITPLGRMGPEIGKTKKANGVNE